MQSITDFIQFKVEENWTPAVAAAIASGCDWLHFPAGVYHFYPEGTESRYCYFTNNDEGVKRIVFHVEDRDGFSLTGDNAEFIFHGRLVPFRFFNVKNLTMSGIAIDFAQHPVVNGKVLECSEESVTLQFPADLKYWIIDGKICFINDDFRFMRKLMEWQVYDTERMEMAVGRRTGTISIEAEELRPGVVRMKATNGLPQVGDMLIFKPEPRLTPSIVLDDCSDVQLTDLSIYCAGGMGFVAQNSFDVTLKRVIVDVRPGSERLISASDDGVHFANCGGKITITDCRFAHQWDDAINIHGVYRTYVEHYNHFLRADHFQQMGIPFAKDGERLDIGGKIYTLSSIRHLTKQVAAIETVEPFPGDLPPGTAVLNQDRQPDVEITNCVITSNKPRGILVSSGGKVVIRNNEFHTPGGAVFISGDCNYWFEAGPVKDVLITENFFDNCLYQGYCFSTRAVVELRPFTKSLAPGEFYHRNVRIINNRFRDNHGMMLRAKDTDQLVFKGNRWEFDDTYSFQQPGEHCILENCGHCEIEPPVTDK